MKTSELTGPELDYWVAMVEELTPVDGEPKGYFYWVSERGPESGWFYPSQDWSQGGPLIEKYGLSPRQYNNIDGSENRWNCTIYRKGLLLNSKGLPINEFGPTPLIAAMRALVASQYGDKDNA